MVCPHVLLLDEADTWKQASPDPGFWRHPPFHQPHWATRLPLRTPGGLAKNQAHTEDTALLGVWASSLPSQPSGHEQATSPPERGRRIWLRRYLLCPLSPVFYDLEAHPDFPAPVQAINPGRMRISGG